MRIFFSVLSIQHTGRIQDYLFFVFHIFGKTVRLRNISVGLCLPTLEDKSRRVFQCIWYSRDDFSSFDVKESYIRIFCSEGVFVAFIIAECHFGKTDAGIAFAVSGHHFTDSAGIFKPSAFF